MIAVFHAQIRTPYLCSYRPAPLGPILGGKVLYLWLTWQVLLTRGSGERREALVRQARSRVACFAVFPATVASPPSVVLRVCVPSTPPLTAPTLKATGVSRKFKRWLKITAWPFSPYKWDSFKQVLTWVAVGGRPTASYFLVWSLWISSLPAGVESPLSGCSFALLGDVHYDLSGCVWLFHMLLCVLDNRCVQFLPVSESLFHLSGDRGLQVRVWSICVDLFLCKVTLITIYREGHPKPQSLKGANDHRVSVQEGLKTPISSTLLVYKGEKWSPMNGMSQRSQEEKKSHSHVNHSYVTADAQ